MSSPHYSIDTELYYDDEVSIKTLGTYMYLRHPKAEIYLVSIYGPDVDYVGPPEDAPWAKIANKLWVSHNAAFDALVYQRLIELKTVKAKFMPSEWQCSANMSVYFGAKRDLAGAAKALLGEIADKSTRSKIKGKTWANMIEEGLADEVINYARQDAKLCYQLWLKWADRWPSQEKALGQLTIEMGWHGVYVDKPRVEAGIRRLKQLMFDADAEIPWAGLPDAKGKEIPRLSSIQLALKCREVGIDPPASVAQDSEECENWLNQHGAKHKWVLALRTWRRCNMLLKKLETMLARIQPNGRMGYGLKYFESASGRWAGDNNWNCLTGDHEVLTPEGWQPLATWQPDIPIMQWEPNNQLSFVKANGKVEQHFSGDLIRLQNARIRALMTPDHRVIAFKRGSGTEMREVPAASLLTSRLANVPVGGEFNHGESEFSDVQLQFLVAVAADGHITAKRILSFGFKRQRKIIRMRELLKSVLPDYREIVRPNGVTCFYTKLLPLWVQKGFGDWVLDLSPTQANRVLDELVLWDGMRHPTNNAPIFYTSIKEQAEWVVTLAHLHNRVVSLNGYPRAGGTSWHVYFKQSNRLGNLDPRREVSTLPFEGQVFCPQIPSGAFLVRYDDRIHVTGNCQNLPKEEMFGVDLRACIIPEPGKKLIIADLSQIEPRVTAWIVKDTEFLELCAQGISPYEAHARLRMGWTGGDLKKEDRKLYALRKAEVLSLNYGAGFLKFITMAKRYDCEASLDSPVSESDTAAFSAWLAKTRNLDWARQWEAADEHTRRTFVNSWLVVSEYRHTNPKVVELWESLEKSFKESQVHGVFDLVLPSGRHIFFRQISCRGGQWTAQTRRFSHIREHFYGGKLANVCIQGTARDVFSEALLRLKAAGFPPVLQIHDEVVCEVEPSVTCEEISTIMSAPVAWLPGCPLACESRATAKYEK